MGKEKINNYCKFDSQLLTFFTSFLFISGLVATFLASPVTRACGRKASILIGGAAFITGSALGGAAENIFMLIFSRLLLGIGFGFANQHFKARIFFFLAVCVAAMTGFVYVLLPETKDVPLEKMDTIWRENWLWKRFVDDGKEHRGN
ncbi:UNVERIFIED_CONTAM: Hexose carrier protein HEX6 [Sesamum calycinum]|uniref:Hexose carrier protein HEX6 n=1 Tax=Sesamum calycinum TaxID=2727403 RepID=A0AAW2JD46_9LAMI